MLYEVIAERDVDAAVDRETFRWVGIRRVAAGPLVPDVDIRIAVVVQRVDQHDAESLAAALGLTEATRFVNVLEVGYQYTTETAEPVKKGWEVELKLPRITSYNVCYTKLLRERPLPASAGSMGNPTGGGSAEKYSARASIMASSSLPAASHMRSCACGSSRKPRITSYNVCYTKLLRERPF